MPKFDAPHEVTDADLAFGGKVRELMPDMADIPAEFHRHAGIWQEWQREWFFSGLKEYPTPKPGIDVRKAMRHLGVIQGSWEPKHEHKQAAVAYLASLWFTSPAKESANA